MSDQEFHSQESHPAIRFRQVPVVPGPLSRLEEVRSQLLDDVVKKTREDFSEMPLESLLGEALYSERFRLKRAKPNIFTRSRVQGDRQLWSQVQRDLLRPAAEADRLGTLDEVIRHYAEEIGGHFDPRVYHLATRAVPWGFSWLLNAASVKRFLPWGMTESLKSRLHILGEVPHLQKLAEKGTILLVPTHQSNIDSILIGYVIYLMLLPPFSYGAGLNLFSNPILDFFMSRLGSYTVDREKANEIYKYTLKNYSTRILKEGIHSIFFPGGGRSRSGAIETKVKLGLLGTALEAQIEGIRSGRPKSRVFVVPMVMSYHFVLEASSLIEGYLAQSGKYKYLATDEAWRPSKVLGFFWKAFSSQTAITVRVGKPLDIFGNFVDEEGQSIGPNGTTIDPARWLTTRGEVRREPQRDQEYTRALGERLSDRFHKENTVLTSHLVAFAFFETLRSRYRDYDLFRFLRLSQSQRSLFFSDFLVFADIYHQKLRDLAKQGELFLSRELQNSVSPEVWVRDGVRHLGLLHDAEVIKIVDDVMWSEDMNLLYYYRNRLSGYGLSLRSAECGQHYRTQNDSTGFLA